MKAHSIILIICLIITTGCLGAGFILTGYWLILPGLLVNLFIWIYAGYRRVFWMASCSLLVTVFLAAIGIITSLSSILMIVVCSTALVCWDLIHFNQSKAGISPGKTKGTLDRYHLQSLAIATFAGLIVGLSSSYLNLHFPFFVIILLVLMTVASLIYGTQYILKKKT
jgi:hypothetical protein